MKPSRAFVVFLVALVLAAAFVYVSSENLPPVVASHFSAGGTADSFMPRESYLALMLGATVGAPLLVALLAQSVRLFPARLINLPNRDYWLAPERIDETMTWLENRGALLGILVAGFMCFVHWQVLLANKRQPPHFPESLFIPGFLVFLAVIVVWAGTFAARFRRRD
jgi:hypothetical protein